jgi:predicted N-formylglutamate amidohydrolase
MSTSHLQILEPGEPPAVEVHNLAGRSTALVLCDHASRRVPASLANLGLTKDQLGEHIGWDIGAANVARRLSALLDATAVLSGYSRLVVDCNRPLGSPTSIAPMSGGIVVPGNARVSEEEARARADACFWPYHRTIERVLDERKARGVATVLLSIHSFTPSLLGQDRPWHVALLYGRDKRLAGHFIDELAAISGLEVGDNQPYQVTDSGDFSLPAYGERRGLHHAIFEIRQDGIGTEEGARAWADRLAELYGRIEARLIL